MTLSRDQLNAYEANNQNEFALNVADEASGYLQRGTDLGAFLHLPLTFKVVSEEQVGGWNKTKNDVIRDGSRQFVSGLMDDVPVAKDIMEAIGEFIGQIVDYLTETLGITTDRKAVIEQFKKTAGDIQKTLDNELPLGIDRKLVGQGVIEGLRDAGSSISAVQEQIQEEAQGAIGEFTGNHVSKATEAAASASAGTYRRVYTKLVDDYKIKHSDYKNNPEEFDQVRRQAHDAAARASGVYMKEDGTFEPAKGADGKYYGIFGYIHEGISQVENGQEVTATYRLAPSDALARAADKAQSASQSQQDASVTPPSAPTKQNAAALSK